MPLPFSSPPQSLCILRLSAVGDVCHTLPVVRTIQAAWPQTAITWITGKTEADLLRGTSGIDFIVFDKSRGWRAYLEVRKQLGGRHFDALLHMQMSLRSSLVNRLVNTGIRIGFGRRSGKDLQWLFNNVHVPEVNNQHVMDSLFTFAQVIGIDEKVLRWEIPVTPEDKARVDAMVGDAGPILVISPCSSMSYRNWHARGYAAVANYAASRYAMRVILSGGPSPTERRMGEQIMQQAQHKPLNLIGKTNLKQLLYLLEKASVLLSPDSGPAHMATAVRTPVIGLYACTNPDRARPYFSASTVVDKYHQTVMNKFGKPASELPWGTRVRDAGTMDAISVDDVTEKLDLVMAK